MVAGRAAWAEKRKKKAPAKATLERRAREARKKAAENGKGKSKGNEKSSGGGASNELAAAGLRPIQDPEHVKVHKAGLADLEARADAVCDREPWENAMEIMRERKCGWVHSRIVSGRMVILLAQKFRVQAGVVEVLVHRVKAEAGEDKRTRLRLKACGWQRRWRAT